MTDEVKFIIDRANDNHYILEKYTSQSLLCADIRRDFFTLVDYIKRNHYTNITTEKLQEMQEEFITALERDFPDVTEVYVDSSMSTYLDKEGKVVAINSGQCRVTDKKGNELKSEIWNTPHSNNFYEARAILLAVFYFIENRITNGIIYSDSQTARAWFNNGKVGKVKYNQYEIEKMIHHYNGAKQLLGFELKMWDTKTNGENPADYGKK